MLGSTKISVAALAAVLTFSISAGAASADDRVTLSLSQASKTRETLSISGQDGRYNKMSATELELSLKLKANLTEDGSGYKIVASDVSLEQGDGASKADALDGKKPQRELDFDDTFKLTVLANGSVAEKAIALCNGRASGDRANAETLDLKVPVTWAVTSGRFNFRAMGYQIAKTDDDALKNPDLYGDREIVKATQDVTLPVQCTALNAASDAKPVAKVEPLKEKPAAEAKADDAQKAKTAEKTAETKLVDTKTEDAKPVATASVAPSDKPACNGGMVREVGDSSNSFLCLCPGNTERVEVGANAFSCERKVARK